MRIRTAEVSLAVVLAAAAVVFGAEPQTPPAAPAAGAVPASDVTPLALPGAPEGGVFLDYLAVDRGRHHVWVPAGGTGNTVVIDTETQEIIKIDKFPTAEVERRGTKRVVGPSSATIGDGFVYVGNRADSSVCAIDAQTFERKGCVVLPMSPDGVAFVAARNEVWVTAPRDATIVILDVSKPEAPALDGTIKLEGGPEGYAVDKQRGFFYTNLEDKDRTLRIDVTSRKVIADWAPACGESGPRGLALEPDGQLLMVACTDHVEVLDAGKAGEILSKLDTGEGVDNIDYVPSRRSLYVAAGGAAKLTVAHVDEKGVLQRTASAATAKGARNAVATDEGVAYVADGPDGKVLVIRPAESH
jgi:DNA-binding beta-propeller fold protein YncE